jgi:hypothetical protein
MLVFFLLLDPINSLKKKYTGGGTNITVDSWFIKPDPNPV